MRILVTGGAGYIGSHTVRLLAQHGHDVCVVDSLERGHAAAIPRECLIQGDIRDTPLLQSALAERKIEGVIHFAGLTYVGESMADPGAYYNANVIGTLNLLDAMRSQRVERLVFSSTAAVYGNPRRSPIDEDDSREPINPYGYSKLIAEQMMTDYARAYRSGFTALRYFNAAGAHPDGDIGEDHDPETHVIPLILQVALGRRAAFQVFGDDYPTPDGTCIRDYVHVMDLAAAHVLAIEQTTPGTSAFYNLGTGRGYSVREVIEACQNVTRVPIPVELGPRRAGDPPELVASAERARRSLGWAPRYTDIESIVETAWTWTRSHPRGFES